MGYDDRHLAFKLATEGVPNPEEDLELQAVLAQNALEMSMQMSAPSLFNSLPCKALSEAMQQQLGSGASSSSGSAQRPQTALTVVPKSGVLIPPPPPAYPKDHTGVSSDEDRTL